MSVRVTASTGSDPWLSLTLRFPRCVVSDVYVLRFVSQVVFPGGQSDSIVWWVVVDLVLFVDGAGVVCLLQRAWRPRVQLR
jgi:hypothetical protein